MSYETVFAASNMIAKDGAGNVLLDVELFDMDCLISMSQAGLDMTDVANVQVSVQRLVDLIKSEFDVTVTRTNAWQIMETVRIGMRELKKKLPSTQTLPTSTDSTPSA